MKLINMPDGFWRVREGTEREQRATLLGKHVAVWLQRVADMIDEFATCNEAINDIQTLAMSSPLEVLKITRPYLFAIERHLSAILSTVQDVRTAEDELRKQIIKNSIETVEQQKERIE